MQRLLGPWNPALRGDQKAELVAGLCRDLRGTVSGVVAAVLVATNPYFVGLSWVMHMEVPMAFFIVLGLATLAAYMKIGYEHRDRVGERYTPSWVTPNPMEKAK